MIFFYHFLPATQTIRVDSFNNILLKLKKNIKEYRNMSYFDFFRQNF